VDLACSARVHLLGLQRSLAGKLFGHTLAAVMQFPKHDARGRHKQLRLRGCHGDEACGDTSAAIREPCVTGEHMGGVELLFIVIIIIATSCSDAPPLRTGRAFPSRSTAWWSRRSERGQLPAPRSPAPSSG